MKMRFEVALALLLLVPASLLSTSALSQEAVSYLLGQYHQTREEILEMSFYLNQINSTAGVCGAALRSLNGTLERASELASQAEFYIKSDLVKASVLALRALNTLTPLYLKLSKCISLTLTSAPILNATVNRTTNRTMTMNATVSCARGISPYAFVKRAEVLLNRLERALKRAEAVGLNTSEFSYKISELMAEINSINSTNSCEMIRLINKIKEELNSLVEEYKSFHPHERHGHLNQTHLNQTTGYRSHEHGHGKTTTSKAQTTTSRGHGGHSGGSHRDRGKH